MMMQEKKMAVAQQDVIALQQQEEQHREREREARASAERAQQQCVLSTTFDRIS